MGGWVSANRVHRKRWELRGGVMLGRYHLEK